MVHPPHVVSNPSLWNSNPARYSKLERFSNPLPPEIQSGAVFETIFVCKDTNNINIFQILNLIILFLPNHRLLYVTCLTFQPNLNHEVSLRSICPYAEPCGGQGSPYLDCFPIYISLSRDLLELPMVCMPYYLRLSYSQPSSSLFSI